VPRQTPVTVSAEISTPPGASATLITAAGRVVRVVVGRSDPARLRWEIDPVAARFARLEVREGARGRPGAMVALTNPVWLNAG
jgi:hypothetical protein